MPFFNHKDSRKVLRQKGFHPSAEQQEQREPAAQKDQMAPCEEPESERRALTYEAPSVPVNKTRRILLVVLPLVAIALLGVLVLLLVNMPKAERTRLEPLRDRPEDTRALRETVRPPKVEGSESQSISPSDKEVQVMRYMRLKSQAVPKKQMDALIHTAAGVRPGKLGDLPPLYITPPELQRKTIAAAGDKESLQSSQQPVEPAMTSGDGLPISESEANAALRGEAGEAARQAALDALQNPEVVTPDEVEASGFQASGMTAYIAGSIVNVRSESNLNSEVLAEVHAGDVVTELETNGSWSKVRLQDGFEGFIFSNLLSYNYVAPEEQSLPEVPGELPPDGSGSYTPPAGGDFQAYSGRLWATNSGVNIRSGPSTDSPVIGTMFYGDYCDAVGYSGGWFQIAWYDGELAYVHGDFLTETEIASEDIYQEMQHSDVSWVEPSYVDPSTLAGGNAVVNTALQYVGCPYVWGAAGPNAFDCSGFTSYVYGQMGISLSRTTYTQVNDGIPVNFGYRDYSNLVPGDLLLFAQGSDIYHVGIYIGGGQMVHAGTAATGVIVDDLNLEYWASRLAYVRRVIY